MNARDHFLMLARYHVWATDQLLDRHVARLSDDDYRRDVGLFFKSVHGTLNHLLVAERGLWFERIVNGQSPKRTLNEEVHRDRATLHPALKQAARDWLPAIGSWDEARFDGTLHYTSTQGVRRTVPFTPTLTHVFNHGTHHRGLPVPQDRGPMLSWLMFVPSGIGPFTGQCVHFKHYAPEPNPYAVNRYDFEAWLWGWARAVPFALGAEAWQQLPHVKRLLDAVNERPAAQRAAALKDRHAFKTEMDDEARRAMFPQNERLKA